MFSIFRNLQIEIVIVNINTQNFGVQIDVMSYDEDVPDHHAQLPLA